MEHEVSPLLERESQLNLIAYFVILALTAVSGVLVFMLIARVEVPSFWIFSDNWVRALSVATVFGIVIYLADQQRRLQLKLQHSYAELLQARAEIMASVDRFAFAQHAAEIMVTHPQDEGLRELLSQVAEHFGANASAVVGADLELSVRNEEYREAARDAVMRASIETVGRGTPLTLSTFGDGSTALAVPLRVKGHLKNVLCIWRKSGSFPEQTLDGLQLVARIVELGMENSSLRALDDEDYGESQNRLDETWDMPQSDTLY
ncbi:MAG: hypothetical protein HGA39_04545 [Coriobacteriia bacterium]|nr:hypothetical protein [Coriobacteriia bacterium]